MSGSYRLAVCKEFSAAHALRHYQGKCEKMHGHNFTVEIKIKGSELDPLTGMLVDFSVLKNGLQSVLSGLDHTILNSTPPFDVINPSSERLAQYIGQKMREFMKNNPACARATLAEVVVGEKNGQSAAWIAGN